MIGDTSVLAPSEGFRAMQDNPSTHTIQPAATLKPIECGLIHVLWEFDRVTRTASSALFVVSYTQ